MIKRTLKTIHHYFVPNENNNFRAKMLHVDVLAIFLVFAIFLSVFTATEFGRNILGFAVDIKQEQILTYVNEVRTNHGLTPVKINEQLVMAAYAKANDMFTNNYWAHFGSDGTTPWQFITGAGYNYKKAGENLAQGFSYSKDVVDKWMTSPTHAANILEPEYEDMGIAIVNGNLQGEDTTLVVQLFGKKMVSSGDESSSENIASGPNGLVAQAKEEIMPTIVPTTIENINTTQPQTSYHQKSTVMTAAKDVNNNPYNIPFNISLTILILLSTALVIDFVYAYKLKIFRVTSKNIAHLFFISIIIVSIFLLTQGRIL